MQSGLVWCGFFRSLKTFEYLLLTKLSKSFDLIKRQRAHSDTSSLPLLLLFISAAAKKTQLSITMTAPGFAIHVSLPLFYVVFLFSRCKWVVPTEFSFLCHISFSFRSFGFSPLKSSNLWGEYTPHEVGVNLKNGYNGDLTSREAGSVGGQMVKKMIESYEKNL